MVKYLTWQNSMIMVFSHESFRIAIAVITTVLIITTSYISAGIATEKTAKAQVPGVYSFKLGKFTIAAFSDGTV